MNAAESKSLAKGTRAYWQGNAADGGTVTEQLGTRSRSPGTMATWQLSTMATCVR
jgi:hypothetical protein